MVLLAGGGVLVVAVRDEPGGWLEYEGGHGETNPCAGCRSERSATAEAMELTRTSLLLAIFALLSLAY